MSGSSVSTVVLGEALVDVVHRADGSVARVPGGSAANTALALARLGRPTTLSTCLGEDADGQLVRRRLEDSGLLLSVAPVPRTSTALARIGADGSADYTFDVVWDPAPELPGSPDHLHVGSLGAVLAPGAQTVHALADRVRESATISYDVNVRPTLTGTGPEVVRSVAALLGVVDVVKLSDEDLDHLWPGEPVEDATRAILAHGATAVVVTRGGEGASWFGAAGRTDVAAAAGQVVDTIGAGDTFSAGVVAALAERGALGAGGRDRLRGLGANDWRDVLDFAARAAAVTVSREGADPPYASEL